MTTIKQNLATITQQIEDACQKAGRSATEVTCIAVTKSVSVERTQEAIDTGMLHVGENRPEGLLHKQEHITAPVVWHYIGSLQTRKVKQVIQTIDYLHSLDRMSLVEEIQKRADKTVKCFVQVNVSGEESKHGLTPADAIAFVKTLAAYDRIEVVGLMTMAPDVADEAVIRRTFSGLKEVQQQICALQLPYAPCHELSMGMSGDFAIAIEEGATFIRIGTALVGE